MHITAKITFIHENKTVDDLVGFVWWTITININCDGIFSSFRWTCKIILKDNGVFHKSLKNLMAIFSCLKSVDVWKPHDHEKKKKQREIVSFDKTKVTIVKVIKKILC